MILLELFCGTNLIGKQFPGEVISLDIAGESPTHQVNILGWDYSVYPRNHFTMIWASPPWTMYSKARNNAKTPRDLEGADRLVQAAIDIIFWFTPQYWFMENPWSGLLRHRAVVEHLPSPKKVSYCKYGFPYQKHTAVWTNTDIEFPVCSKDCDAIVPGTKRHRGTALQGRSKCNTPGYPLNMLHSLPPKLCQFICEFIAELETQANASNRECVRGIELPRGGPVGETSEESGHTIYQETNTTVN